MVRTQKKEGELLEGKILAVEGSSLPRNVKERRWGH